MTCDYIPLRSRASPTQCRAHRVAVMFHGAPYHSEKSTENTRAISLFRPYTVQMYSHNTLPIWRIHVNSSFHPYQINELKSSNVLPPLQSMKVLDQLRGWN